MNHKFSPHSIDHHVESVTVLIQPPVDIRDDRIHLQEFFNRVSERQPQLYDSLTQQPGAFAIRKQLLLPRVGRLEVVTFSLTPAGLVLSFPRKLPFTPDDLPWSADLNAEIASTVSTFLECHTGRVVLRLRKRRELIFATGQDDSAGYLQRRFAPGIREDAQDVGVRWARNDDQYECRVTLDAVYRRKVVQEIVEGIPIRREEPQPEFGIRLVVEVSNRCTPKPFSAEEWKIILDHADSFYNEVLADLRRTQGGDTP